MTDVLQLTHDAIAAVTEDDWVSSCRHVEEVERKYWDADIAVEAEMEKIVIKNTIVKHLKYNKNMIKSQAIMIFKNISFMKKTSKK